MPIKVENLTYIYMPGTPFESTALDNVTLQINDGEFVGLIGHTGSGKSTLVQHLNGLLKASSGKIFVDDIEITAKGTNLKAVRQKVGLVFQYPEHQLFEETVYKDVAFGPKNLGLSNEEVDLKVRQALEMVGLDYEESKVKSPFDLSGGQRRRVAIAGVLAMDPKVLILDEPTAGLDPRGRDAILGEIKSLHDKYNKTTILVSHSMEDIAKLVDRIIVMNEGRCILTGSPKDIFKEADTLIKVGLGIPQVTALARELKSKGIDFKDDVLTIEEAKQEIIKFLRSRKS
ncbi:energy-coupling factor transporter ATP-binding protein EcfA2 [Oxobacter pfennigii]|uniref:Energy-coupling factor transporter ATP-binding protein EcfA2 n=1 Tax=Oxobacter pfennigii TaxID=36849 RepID=A0A0P8Y7S3_9CLOT|nr:energy-coupling factor transporter ATPase [Oxobacter pfennigii]KPU42603.1 energy-coupling factor transporter ATP-binding protein EcfA2 [Oxobacter pfennigii]